jgi:hypothetical protein
MRIGRLTLLPILLLPQFLACGEGARPKGAASVAGQASPVPADDAGELGEEASDWLTAAKPASGSAARGKIGNASASKSPAWSSR